MKQLTQHTNGSKYTDMFPFSAIVGQEDLKLSLILNAINPLIGGVLIRGEKGTAKSTTVRALSAMLPEINVSLGCPFSCDPDDKARLCNTCKNNNGDIQTVFRQKKVVTLPLNATEDRVAGGIDFNKAVKEGIRTLEPGVLADAHRGILYVDEINLLDDHIVDIILDAAADKMNRIEREGISFRHPSDFILIGTMNPEEGDLRPQLLDRFGLCVEVVSEKEPDLRILMMERREAFDRDPQEFYENFAKKNKETSERIVNAQAFISQVKFPDHLRHFISELATENNVAGHRADLVIVQAAKTHAAYMERKEVTIEDIQVVAPMALLHRIREAAPPPPPPPPPPPDENQDKENEEPPERTEEDSTENKETPPEPQNQEEQQAPEPDTSEEDQDAKGNESPEEQPREMPRDNILEQIFDIGETFKVKKISSPKDRVFRRGSGKRSRTRISQKQGRYVKSTVQRKNNDIALDATLRAAAPYQLSRANQQNGLSVCLKAEDIREKIREKRIGNFLVFLVDASGSMGSRGRMTASKGAIISILMDAYQKRDKVAMLSFRQNEAFVNLPPTSSIELAANLLKEMPVGGRTPLSAGLAKTHEVIRNYLLREPTSRPIVIIITDGKSNVAMGSEKPVDEALLFAEKLSADDRVKYIVVDTEQEGIVRFELAQKLSVAAGARYFKINDLKADALLDIVKGVN